MSPPSLVICQARMESQRFPGKVLAPLLGKPMLLWVLDRLAMLQDIARLVVAAPNTPPNRKIYDLCQAHDYQCELIDGNPNDVLRRFAVVAAKYDAEDIIRVTGDCPLISGDAVARLYDMAHSHQQQYDYIGISHAWGDGTDCEWLTREALVIADADTRLASDREHVTPYIWRHPTVFTCATLECPMDLSSYQYSVDTPHDLAMIQRILASNLCPSWLDISMIIDHDPILAAWQRERTVRGHNSAYTAQVVSEQALNVVPTWEDIRYGEK